MKIQSVRLGHANNSSSTHSILLNATGRPKASESGDFQYGWDWFHLKDREDKGKYLATMIYNVLSNDGMSPEHAGIIARDLTAYDPHAQAEDGYAYVDHQSVLVFPRKISSGVAKYFRHDFMKEFVAYVRDNEAVSIKGGNDNEDEPVGGVFDWSPDTTAYNTAVQGERVPLNELTKDYAKLLLFGKKDGDWWILYNKETGAKIRLSFKKDPAPYLAGRTPELVDVKITDNCSFGCSFCYQDSTKSGKHAKVEDIRRLASDLEQAEVFEVALGGGEPTQHPEFTEILKAFHRYGITVNFTTFNMDWTKNGNLVKDVEEYCGSFAVSNPAETERIKEWNEDHPKGPRATLQIPLGCHPEEALRKVLGKVVTHDVPVTFLGFKHFGRGETFKPHDYSWVVDFLMGSPEWCRFGADSLFVGQFGEDLKRRGISEKLMVTKEGAFSCYIDAVSYVMGPSSYTKDLHPVNVRNVFDRFPYAKL